MAEATKSSDPDGVPPARQNSYDYDELLACARGELFYPDSAKLPHSKPFMSRLERLRMGPHFEALGGPVL